jgi:hypothetical protein
VELFHNESGWQPSKDLTLKGKLLSRARDLTSEVRNMKSCRYCGLENEERALSCGECGKSLTVDPANSTSPIVPRIRLRWILCGILALALLFGSSEWVKRHPPPRPKLGIVVLASCVSNGQQLVTFQPEPPEAEITFAGVASALDNGTVQPATVGSPECPVPLHRPDETNYTLRFVATPLRSASMGSMPLAYTPGSYTVAYTPQQPANRVRVGVALLQRGPPDMKRRIFNAWAQKSLAPLLVRSHLDPVFVVTKPFTNAAVAAQ